MLCSFWLVIFFGSVAIALDAIDDADIVFSNPSGDEDMETIQQNAFATAISNKQILAARCSGHTGALKYMKKHHTCQKLIATKQDRDLYNSCFEEAYGVQLPEAFYKQSVIECEPSTVNSDSREKYIKCLYTGKETFPRFLKEHVS